MYRRVYLHIHMHLRTCVCVYIYIYMCILTTRERERERERLFVSWNTSSVRGFIFRHNQLTVMAIVAVRGISLPLAITHQCLECSSRPWGFELLHAYLS